MEVQHRRPCIPALLRSGWINMVETPVFERLIVKIYERRCRRILRLFIQIHVPHGGINATYSSYVRIISPRILIHGSRDSCVICDTAIVRTHCSALVMQKAGQMNCVVLNVGIELPIPKYVVSTNCYATKSLSMRLGCCDSPDTHS